PYSSVPVLAAEPSQLGPRDPVRSVRVDCQPVQAPVQDPSAPSGPSAGTLGSCPAPPNRVGQVPSIPLLSSGNLASVAPCTESGNQLPVGDSAPGAQGAPVAIPTVSPSTLVGAGGATASPDPLPPANSFGSGIVGPPPAGQAELGNTPTVSNRVVTNFV